MVKISKNSPRRGGPRRGVKGLDSIEAPLPGRIETISWEGRKNYRAPAGTWILAFDGHPTQPRRKRKAPPRFELGISCLLDRRFNQLSHGAWVFTSHRNSSTEPILDHVVAGCPCLKKMCAQRGARTHDPEIKSLMLYRLS